MYFLFKMGIFQPAMFVYRRVIQKAWLGLGSMLFRSIFAKHVPVFFLGGFCRLLWIFTLWLLNNLTWPMAKLWTFWDYIFSREDKVQTFISGFHWLYKWVMEIQMYVMFDYIVQCVIFVFTKKQYVCVPCSCSPFQVPKFTPHQKKRRKTKRFFRNIFNSMV